MKTAVKRPRTNLAVDTVLVVFPSELGWMAAIFRQSRLARLTFGHRTRKAAVQALGDAPAPSEPDNKMKPVVHRLQAFAAGARDNLHGIEVDYGIVTPFQRQVLDACRAIAPGETLSYGQLAIIAGAPGAARAVGNVMRSNRLPLVVPCHRVVGSSGALGGYSAPEGLAMKRKLLERERK
jgi:methylated-DNA-[protein]-cysteine S-methyltransferase